MSLFRKLFGSSDPLDSLRRARRQNAWADLLVRGGELDPDLLDEAGRSELEALMCEAGDALAAINIGEGEAFARAGDTVRAAEHFALAATQARSDDMKSRIAACAAPPVASPMAAAPPPASAKGCSGGCSAAPSPSVQPVEDELDDQTRMELILSSYPPSWAPRYLQVGDAMRRAFLLSNEGREEEARKFFESVPEQERDDLFHFERGSLLARMGDGKGAVRDLEKALVLNPEHLLAAQSLIDLEIGMGKGNSAEKRLRSLLTHPEAAVFCHGRLCVLEANRKNTPRAIEHGLLAAPGGDPQVIVLTASLLEGEGRLGEAEALLNRLSGGGCSAGPNLALAEFWVRHNINPDKALAAFKGALRHEPDNPRWLLRIAQIYSARGWKKDAASLLEKVLSLANLESTMEREAHDLLTSCRTNGNN